MPTKWYFIDPDNRKKVPTVPHCERCKQPMNVQAVKSGPSFKSVKLSRNGLYATLSPIGAHLIGSDCWDKMVKDGPLDDWSLLDK